MNVKTSLIILAVLALVGCQSTGKSSKAVVVQVEASESNPNEARINVIHDRKSSGQLKQIAKMASKGVLNCDSGQMTVSWLKENTAPQHEDFPAGQNSVSLLLSCVM